MKPHYPIIIIDDEKEIRLTLAGAIESAGFNNLILSEDANSIIPILQEHKLGIVLLDLNMPGTSGLDILPEIKAQFPDTIVIVVTGVHDLATAVSCIKNGAFDYLQKPVRPEKLATCIKHAVEICELRFENVRIKNCLLAPKLQNPEAFSEIVTNNKTMQAIFQYCEAVAQGEQAVLITGETGAGKELIAKAIHSSSQRQGNFVAVNIAGLDVNMLSSTLFGHVKGAFTGAHTSNRGLIAEAAGGTLFLDEIGDLSKEAQIKLLRILQEREYMPVGAVKAQKTDTRIIAATHVDLNELVEADKFRQDLYYRLITHHVHIPPLRERLDDLQLLTDFFIQKATEEFNKDIPSYPPELISLLKTYHFPGNIRELNSMIYDAISTLTNRKLSMRKFKERIKRHNKQSSKKNLPETSILFPDILPSPRECVNLLIIEALKRTNQNQKMAAELLGISQQALNNRLNRKKKKINEHT